MARGVMPRQPARTGRQEGVRAKAHLGKASLKTQATAKTVARPGSAKKSSTEKPSARVKGYNPTSPERVSDILKRLDQQYPDATCALHHKSAWELLVATILSAQSTDVNVNRVTPELFRKYPTVQDFASLTPQQLEPDVRSTGFFRNKSKSVVG